MPPTVTNPPTEPQGSKMISDKMCGTGTLERWFEKGKITIGWSDPRAPRGWGP